MPRVHPRKFTVVDLGLLALVAVGCILAVRASDREFVNIPYAPVGEKPWSRWPAWMLDAVRLADRVELGMQASLGTACVGLAGITYRSRRLRPVRPGPGQVGLLITAGFTVYWTAFDAIADRIYPLISPLLGSSRGVGPVLEWYSYWKMPSPQIFWMLTAAWITLAITGGWRRPVDWTEQAGRALVWTWVAVVAFGEAIAIVAQG